MRKNIKMENESMLKRTDKKEIEYMQQQFIEFMIKNMNYSKKGVEIKQVEDRSIVGTKFSQSGINSINQEQKDLTVNMSEL